MLSDSTGHLVGWFILLAFLIASFRATRTLHLFWKRPLPTHAPDSARALTQDLTILIAGRNEAAALEHALEKWHSVEGDWQLIFIDDRSDDQTPQILQAMQGLDSRITTCRVQQLPAGWLGKNHALHLGVQQTDRSWLLFTDADVIFEPQALVNALHFAESKQLDFLCLMPQMITGTMFEAGLVTAFGFLFVLGTDAPKVRNPANHHYAGIGAFNLIRRSAYEQLGGHERLKLKILDDVMLGAFAKYTGAKCDFLPAINQLSVKWQNSAWGVVCGLEKNAFAALEFSWLSLIALTALSAAGVMVLITGIVIGDVLTQLLLSGLILYWHLLFGWYGWKGTKHWFCLPFLLPSAMLILLAFWRSAWVTTRAGGVRWRETFYSLKDLKHNLQQTPLPDYRPRVHTKKSN